MDGSRCVHSGCDAAVYKANKKKGEEELRSEAEWKLLLMRGFQL